MPSLGNDLAAIRKNLDLSIEDIHQATKIPLHILESIEDDSIFEDLNKNATYIRSYVRSYAKKLEIDEERTIRALDQVERGTYTGILRDDSETGTIPKFTGKPKKSKAEEPEQQSGPEDKQVPEPEETVAKGPAKRPEAPNKTTETPSVHSVDWVDMGKRFTPLRSPSRMWFGLAVIFIAIVVVIGVYYLFIRGPEDPQSSNESQSPVTTTEAVEPDSLQLNLSGQEDGTDTLQRTQTQPAETLSDTLNLVIYAAYEKLEPVRVYTDVLSSLNPYWIELGEAVRFKFVNTIRIRGPYERMELLLNGHLIQNFEEQFFNPESGMVEINRKAFEGEARWLQPPPDSLGLDVPDPTVIRNQPIFN
ncbi:helix-turn-helix domain-containing protein [Balneolaceae bacterium YR4-1]|uniref:Helix-turn-helix domain-containing protein n=1 Tax=Halalkalibaculum roseum TaxID=2709311 RepID=A0A6M1SXW5_9BACT|nr:helix-turn-helix transcriptional regulator [Halalkalibaculum roseum]NGP77118.1 helix-turn-helix domain-containing protein [Halalkalibaculum roseum]